MTGLDEGLLFSLLVRGVLLTAGLYNLRLAHGDYQRFHDARGLRGFVSAITMLAGVVALVGSSQGIRDAWPALLSPMRILTAAGIFAFIAGLLFSVISWRLGRGPRR